MANKNVNVNELQANISSILKEVQKGEVYEVMRYSDPVAVVIPYHEYLKLKGECKRCVEDLRKLVNNPNQ